MAVEILKRDSLKFIPNVLDNCLGGEQGMKKLLASEPMACV